MEALDLAPRLDPHQCYLDDVPTVRGEARGLQVREDDSARESLPPRVTDSRSVLKAATSLLGGVLTILDPLRDHALRVGANIPIGEILTQLLGGVLPGNHPVVQRHLPDDQALVIEVGREERRLLDSEEVTVVLGLECIPLRDRVLPVLGMRGGLGLHDASDAPIVGEGEPVEVHVPRSIRVRALVRPHLNAQGFARDGDDPRLPEVSSQSGSGVLLIARGGVDLGGAHVVVVHLSELADLADGADIGTPKGGLTQGEPLDASRLSLPDVASAFRKGELRLGDLVCGQEGGGDVLVGLQAVVGDLVGVEGSQEGRATDGGVTGGLLPRALALAVLGNQVREGGAGEAVANCFRGDISEGDVDDLLGLRHMLSPA